MCAALSHEYVCGFGDGPLRGLADACQFGLIRVPKSFNLPLPFAFSLLAGRGESSPACMHVGCFA